MKIEDIIGMWQDDVKIDETELSRESIRTPILHGKYLKHFSEQRLKLRNPIYLETAAYGHMGRKHQKVTKFFESPYNGKVQKEVELFTWEKLDLVETFKALFNITS